MHTCLHAYMLTCIHAYMHTCLRAYMPVCECVSACVFEWFCTFAYAKSSQKQCYSKNTIVFTCDVWKLWCRDNIYIYICIDTCCNTRWLYIHTHIYIYICIYTVYIYIYIYVCVCACNIMQLHTCITLHCITYITLQLPYIHTLHCIALHYITLHYIT